MTETVIVAHGLWLPGVETKLLRNRLRNAGFSPLLFMFPTLRGTLEQNVKRLAAFARKAHGDRVHFVGYSLGGVITLRMLAERPPRLVGRVVCLGSPLTGSRVATRVGQTAFGKKIVGRSLAEHVANGGLEHWDLDIELGIIAGTRSFGVGRFVETLDAASDGTVQVSETRLAGAKAHMTLPVTHTQLLFDRSVAQQTVHFLRHGCFVD